MNRCDKTLNLLLLTGLTLLLLAAVFPFFWMLSNSLKTYQAIHSWPPQWIPRPMVLEHYRELLQMLSFGRNFFNSMVVTLSVTAVSLFFNALGGYVFAKFAFPMRDRLFGVLLLTMMVPAQVSLIPVFLILKNLGLLNNYLGLIVPASVSIFGIFLMRQYMLSIPDSYIESARIDGCSELRIFTVIVLPLCGPVLSALAIFTFTSAWSDFMMPLIVMHEQSMYTLPVALAGLSGQHTSRWGLLMAGAVVTVLPILVIFLALQRNFIQGVAMTGIKG